MSIGSSGRIVIEIDPQTKRNLYSALTKKGVTLKDWFLDCADKYLTDLPNQQTDNEGKVITEGNS
jgi:hypothetical protein